MNERKYLIHLTLFAALLILAGCSLNSPEIDATFPVDTDTPAPVVQDTEIPEPTGSPAEEIPLAARVNGEGIPLAGYEASLKQLNASLEAYPDLLAEGQTAQEKVLDALVERALLAQAAREGGFSAGEQMVADRLAQLTEQAGGENAFNTWLTDQGYTPESFKRELALEMEAAWQRDQIGASVPVAMEQVRARQLLFYESFQADRIYGQLQAGVSVDQVVANNDPDNLGYLGWFPRGVLFYPELEEALFALQPGGFSPVIHTEVGYHILIMLEKQDAYPLSPEVRLVLQEKAVESWLETQRAQAQVEVLLP